jgi:predicted RNA-binding Zn-ribbon protein involved in translation (DUF1610 family)
MKIVHIIRDECPICGSDDIYRSKRRGIAEQIACWLTLVRPFRCNACYTRIYAFRAHAKLIRLKLN